MMFSLSKSNSPERPGTFHWVTLRGELNPSAPRVRSALKLALAGTITLALVFQFDWPSPGTALLTVLLIGRPDSRLDFYEAMLAALASLVIGTIYYLMLNLVQDPPWFCLALCGVFTTLGALSVTPKVGKIVSYGLVTPAAVLVNRFYEPNQVGTLFFPTTLQMLLGFTVALAVNSLLWPYSPRREWDEQCARTGRDCRRACVRWFAGGAQPPEATSWLDRFFRLNLDTLSRIIPTDAGDPGLRVRAQASLWLEEVVACVQDLGSEPRAGNDEVRRLWTNSVPGAIRRLGAALDAGFVGTGPGSSVSETSRQELEEALRALPEDSAVRGQGELLLENLRGLEALLAGGGEFRAALARLQATERFTHRRQTLRWTPPVAGRDFLQVGPEQWKHGVQVALTVIAVFWLWQGLTWPNGSSVLTSALIVSLGTLGASARKLILRVLGVGFGVAFSLAATLFVVPHVQTFWGYGLLFFILLAGFSYVTAAGPRVAYIGFQGAVTFVLTFLESPVQSVDLDPLRQRAVAVVLGVLISSVIQQVVWPARRVNQLYGSIAQTFTGCARAWTALLHLPGEKEGASARRETFIAGFNQDFSRSLQLHDDVEFEGGEGSPRYPHAGAMLIQMQRLFRQMLLFSHQRECLPVAGPADAALRRRLESIGESFRTLLPRFGQATPGAFPPWTRGGETRTAPLEPPPDPPRMSGVEARGHRVTLDERAGKIEAALAALDELTLRPPTVSPGFA